LNQKNNPENAAFASDFCSFNRKTPVMLSAQMTTGDIALTSQLRLLIIDEVHLLHEERGAVVETLVVRTLRQVEQTQVKSHLTSPSPHPHLILTLRMLTSCS
jgi:hypothetical protein